MKGLRMGLVVNFCWTILVKFQNFIVLFGLNFISLQANYVEGKKKWFWVKGARKNFAGPNLRILYICIYYIIFYIYIYRIFDYIQPWNLSYMHRPKCKTWNCEHGKWSRILKALAGCKKISTSPLQKNFYLFYHFIL